MCKLRASDSFWCHLGAAENFFASTCIYFFFLLLLVPVISVALVNVPLYLVVDVWLTVGFSGIVLQVCDSRLIDHIWPTAQTAKRGEKIE